MAAADSAKKEYEEYGYKAFNVLVDEIKQRLGKLDDSAIDTSSLDETASAIQSELDQIQLLTTERVYDAAEEESILAKMRPLSSNLAERAECLHNFFESIISGEVLYTAVMSGDINWVDHLSVRYKAGQILAEILWSVASSERNRVYSCFVRLLAPIYDIYHELKHPRSRAKQDEIFQLTRTICMSFGLALWQAERAVRRKRGIKYLNHDLIPYYMRSLESPVRVACRRYFLQRTFNGKTVKNISFKTKVRGIQAGTIAELHLEDDSKVDLYVKAHRKFCDPGTTPETFSDEDLDDKKYKAEYRKQFLDLKEIYVYLVLMHLGLGPKVFLIATMGDKNALFIASQNADFTKTPDRVTKEFVTVGDLYPREERRPKVFDSAFVDELDSELSKAGTSSLKLSAAIIHLFARMFYLRDLHGANFGRTTVTRTREGVTTSYANWKILDFTLPDDVHCTCELDHRTSDMLVSAFVSRAEPRYARTPFLRKTMCEVTSEDLKIIGAKAMQVLHDGLPKQSEPGSRHLPLHSAMGKAMDDIKAFLSNTSRDKEGSETTMINSLYGPGFGKKNLDKVTRSLEQYHAGVRSNLKKFEEGFGIDDVDAVAEPAGAAAGAGC